jgi:hypothetical protein
MSLECECWGMARGMEMEIPSQVPRPTAGIFWPDGSQ